MDKYIIHPKVVRGFRIIANLAQNDLDVVAEIIRHTQIGDNIYKFSEENKDKVSISEDDLFEVIQALYSIINIYIDSKDTPEVFSKDFSDSFKAHPFLSNLKNDLQSLEQNLSFLVSSFGEAMPYTMKARDLLVENEKNYADSRIISDIRIVYDDANALDKKEQVALIIHNFKIDYYNNTEQKTINISLDFSDLHKLKIIVDRAIEKDKLIRNNNHVLTFVNIK